MTPRSCLAKELFFVRRTIPCIVYTYITHWARKDLKAFSGFADLDIEREPVSALYIAQLTPSGDLIGFPRMVEIKGSRYVTSLCFRKGVPGSYLCTTNTGLAYLSETTGALEHLPNELGQIISEADKDKFRFNDGACDKKGRFYFHSMSRDDGAKTGKLYMFEKGMKKSADLRVLEQGFAIGNGPVIDEQRKRMYFNFTESGIGCQCANDPLPYVLLKRSPRRL